ncbi:MAG TPA: PAS domain-containing protein [Stellaceae bacterium]|nr:PAS domain-containing protein [Stellaceae bacterium]
MLSDGETRDSVILIEITADGRFQVAGCDPSDAPAPEVTAAEIEHYRRCARSRAPVSYETTLDAVTGERRFRTRLTPIRAADGTITRIVAIRRDTTTEPMVERDREGGERYFRALAENSPDPIVCYDRQRRRVYANPAHAAATGVPGTDLQGKTPSQRGVFGGGQTAKYLAWLDRIFETGFADECEVHWQDQDGDHWYSIRGVPERGPGGDVMGVMTIARDMTERVKAEQEFRSLVENSPDLIARYDRDGKILYRNPALRRLVEEAGKAPGKSPATDTALVKRDDVIEKLSEVVATGRSGELETEYHDRMGHVKYASIRFEPEFDADGQVQSVLTIGRDMTQLKQSELSLRASEEKAARTHILLLDAINSIDDDFLLWDAEGRLVLANKVFDRVGFPVTPGMTYADFIRSAIQDSKYLDGGGSPDEFANDLISRHAVPGTTYDLRLASGRIVSVRRTPTSEGGVVSIGTDITAHRQREAELQAARANADRANRAKTEFLAHMSHELRTPLNAIIGFSELLQLNLPGTLTPAQQEYVQDIHSSGKHLLDLIQDVLDFASSETGHLKLSPKPIKVPLALSQVYSLLLPVAGKANVQLALRDADVPDVVADELRLHQVLINLVSNAIKYNRTGGFAEIAAEVTADDRIRFMVTDTGWGIAPERWGQLFRPFERLGARHASIEGTGIGLALVKQLVEAMDGSVGFTSEAGRGSRFWVDLPRAATTDPTAFSNGL